MARIKMLETDSPGEWKTLQYAVVYNRLERVHAQETRKGLGLIISFYTSMHNMVKNTLNRTLKLSSTEIGPCMRTHTMNVCRLAGETLGCRLTMGRQSEMN